MGSKNVYSIKFKVLLLLLLPSWEAHRESYRSRLLWINSWGGKCNVEADLLMKHETAPGS